MAEPLSAADRGSLQAERGPVNMAVAGLLADARLQPGLDVAAAAPDEALAEVETLAAVA